MRTDDGFIAESCVANVAFILPGNKFVTPPFDEILTGCTMQRIIFHANELLRNGVLSSVEMRPIHLDEAKTCIEMFLSSADAVKPILEWDRNVIGNGVRGVISQMLIDMVQNDFNDPELTENIPYELY